MTDASDEPKWKEDFPIDWDEDHYVTRRDLAKFLTLGSGLLVAANAAVAIGAHVRTPRPHPRTRVASASALKPGESLLFRYPTPADPCILVRTRGGALAAYSQVCTHLSCAVVHRRDDDRLFCPCHEGVFECGAATAGARPLEGPPQRPLPQIALEVVGDDVFATGVVSS